MSMLNDSSNKLKSLIVEAERHHRSYAIAHQALEQVEGLMDNTQTVNLSDLGMNLQFSDVQIPVPLPNDPAVLRELLISGMNFLGQQLAKTWNEIYVTAQQAATYCDNAVQDAMRPELSQPEVPATGQPITPPAQPAVVNVPQLQVVSPVNTPTLPVQPTQPQPRVRPVVTTPVP